MPDAEERKDKCKSKKVKAQDNNAKFLRDGQE